MADSRIEKQLKKILGESVVTEPPQSRVEVLVQEIIDQGGGGSGGGGSGGGGSAEPFFFVAEMKGLDPQSGEPIFEETSTTYNDVISKINSGCPIYGHMIVPPEYSSGMLGFVDEISSLVAVTHYYDSVSNTHTYGVNFAHIDFFAHSPTDVLSMHGSGGDIPVE